MFWRLTPCNAGIIGLPQAAPALLLDSVPHSVIEAEITPAPSKAPTPQVAFSQPVRMQLRNTSRFQASQSRSHAPPQLQRSSSHQLPPRQNQPTILKHDSAVQTDAPVAEQAPPPSTSTGVPASAATDPACLPNGDLCNSSWSVDWAGLLQD